MHVGTSPRGRAAGGVISSRAGSKPDHIDDATESFLRHVDTVVEAEVSRPTGLPLLLVAGVVLLHGGGNVSLARTAMPVPGPAAAILRF